MVQKDVSTTADFRYSIKEGVMRRHCSLDQIGRDTRKPPASPSGPAGMILPPTHVATPAGQAYSQSFLKFLRCANVLIYAVGRTAAAHSQAYSSRWGTLHCVIHQSFYPRSQSMYVAKGRVRSWRH